MTLSTKEHIGNLALISRYRQMANDRHIRPHKSFDSLGVHHAMWMLEMMSIAIHDKDPAFDDGKCGRWMGFIQNEIINDGWTTVEYERDFSRPYFKAV